MQSVENKDKEREVLIVFLEIRNNNRVYGLTDEQVEVLKDHLTFDNPKYKSAKRYSKSRYITIPPYLYYYTQGSDSRGSYIDFPIGVDVQKLLKYKIDPVKHSGDGMLVSCTSSPVDYPKFCLTLRDTQEEAKKSYLDTYFKSRFGQFPKSLISLPTGKGKTILALNLAAELKAKLLVLVHKDDLVEGWKKDIDLCFGGKVKAGLIKAKKREVGKQITIATVQTLSRMSPEELSKYTDEFGMVVQDECHHVGLNIFNVIDKFNCAYKIGLSATPKRSDGLDFVFDLYFGGVCYEYKAGVDDEDISNVEVRVLDSPYKYRPFLHKGEVFNYYDFKPYELPKELVFVDTVPYQSRPAIPYLNIDNQAVMSSMTRVTVCKKILEHYRQGQSCLALFTQKEHINAYYRYLKIYVPEEHIMLYYGDSKEKSDVMMEKAENKEVLITLATYAKATEGTNVKAWEVEFLVSSLNNEKNTEQATGRIRRRKKDKIDPVIVYDVRYSECYSLASHFNTRAEVYKKLNYKVLDPKAKVRKSVFSRGYSIDRR